MPHPARAETTEAAVLRRLADDPAMLSSVSIADPRLPDTPLIAVSDGFTTQTGYARDEVLGRNCRFLQGQVTDPAAMAAIRAALARLERLEIDILNYRKDGEPFWNRLLLGPVIEGGELTYYVGAQRPIDRPGGGPRRAGPAWRRLLGRVVGRA